MFASFLHFSVFLCGGLSSHSNFSTSAAICAMGERGGNRNRVTGQELYINFYELPNFEFCPVFTSFHEFAEFCRIFTSSSRNFSQVLKLYNTLSTSINEFFMTFHEFSPIFTSFRDFSRLFTRFRHFTILPCNYLLINNVFQKHPPFPARINVIFLGTMLRRSRKTGEAWKI